MPKTIMKVEGMDGQVELMSDRVVIHRAGLWNAMKFGMNAKREIPLSAISEVAFRPAGLKFGEIEFVRSGRSTDEKKQLNANAVRFNRKKNKEFEEMKEKVFHMIDQYSRSRNS